MPPNFDALYQLYADRVYNLCLNYLQNRHDAEEVTQDVFVKVYQQMHRFEGKSQWMTWIYRITVRQCIDFLRAQQRQKRSVFTLFGNKHEALPVWTDFDHPGVQLEQKEAVEKLFRHMNQLPEQQKTALVLKTLEGLSQQEIAEVMNLSVKAVESLLSRARKNLSPAAKDDSSNNV